MRNNKNNNLIVDYEFIYKNNIINAQVHSLILIVLNQKIIFSLSSWYIDYWLAAFLSWELTISLSYLLTICCTVYEFIKGATSVVIIDCILWLFKNIKASPAIVYL